MFDTEILGFDQYFFGLQGVLAELLRRLGELDQAEVWHGSGYASMSRWLSARHHVTFSTAREWVRVARALRELPGIARAFHEGFLTWDQIRPLTMLASAETDEHWAGTAEGMSPAELWEKWRSSLEIERHEEQAAHAWRYLQVDWNDEKTECYLQGRLGAEKGAILDGALRKRAARIDANDAHDPAAAAMADAAVALVSEGKGGRALEPLLVVHTDVTTLEGAPGGLAETSSGARLSPEAVCRLAGRAKIEWVLESEGRCVGIGFQSKHPPPWLGRRLAERDRTCRFPGCGANRHLKAHHIMHWPAGRTDLPNLVLLCAFHHNLVHKGGWRIRGHPEGKLEFVDPRGRASVSVPGRRFAYMTAPAEAGVPSLAG